MSNPKFKSHSKIDNLLEDTVLLLVCSLPLLVPLSFNRNFDLQGMVLIITGLIAWALVIMRLRVNPISEERWLFLPLAVYVVACVFSLFTYFNTQNIFGTDLYRLGSLGLIASIGCALALRTVQTERLIRWLYFTIVLVALTAGPYDLLVNQSLSRLGGVFSQANILAVFMGVGIIIGFSVWQSYPKHRKYLFASQMLMVLVLLGTQTRSIILLMPVIVLLMAWRLKIAETKKMQITGGIVILSLVLLGSLALLTTSRISDVTYANKSLSYRLDLQKAGLTSSTAKPLLGYGTGNIENALKCSDLKSPSIKESCDDGYYFTSTHNIYLDRILAIGWIGGLAYSLFVQICLYLGLRLKGQQIQILSYCALVIAIYYLTNVTSVALELLFVILLLRISRV